MGESHAGEIAESEARRADAETERVRRAVRLEVITLANRRRKVALFSPARLKRADDGLAAVVAPWFRSIPFSISAGSSPSEMLNGLVLVSFSRRLEGRGTPHLEAIRQAAELRLRQVNMTAFVASLGFWPMALSTAPGSEVQRPLATVVIGGLISTTLLTLLLLPVLYGNFGGGPKEIAPSSQFSFRGGSHGA